MPETSGYTLEKMNKVFKSKTKDIAIVGRRQVEWLLMMKWLRGQKYPELVVDDEDSNAYNDELDEVNTTVEAQESSSNDMENTDIRLNSNAQVQARHRPLVLTSAST